MSRTSPVAGGPECRARKGHAGTSVPKAHQAGTVGTPHGFSFSLPFPFILPISYHRMQGPCRRGKAPTGPGGVGGGCWVATRAAGPRAGDGEGDGQAASICPAMTCGHLWFASVHVANPGPRRGLRVSARHSHPCGPRAAAQGHVMDSCTPGCPGAESPPRLSREGQASPGPGPCAAGSQEPWGPRAGGGRGRPPWQGAEGAQASGLQPHPGRAMASPALGAPTNNGATGWCTRCHRNQRGAQRGDGIGGEFGGCSASPRLPLRRRLRPSQRKSLQPRTQPSPQTPQPAAAPLCPDPLARIDTTAQNEAVAPGCQVGARPPCAVAPPSSTRGEVHPEMPTLRSPRGPGRPRTCSPVPDHGWPRAEASGLRGRADRVAWLGDL